MTRDEQLLVLGAVTDEATRGAAVDVMAAATLLTPAYVAWYAVQTPLRQSAEWARGGFLFLQVQRVKVDAAASPGGILGQLGGLAGGLAGGLLGALLRPIAWVLGGALVVLIILGLTLRR